MTADHALRFPADMAAYFRCRWDNESLWKLDLPISELPLRELVWHLDLPFWASDPPERIFDVVPRDVLGAPEAHPVRTARMERAQVAWPLHVTRFGTRIVILDGIHRLARLVRDGGVERVLVRHVPTP